LFTIEPAVKTLFMVDMTQQRMKLVQTLAVVVHSLVNLVAIIPAIQNLGSKPMASSPVLPSKPLIR
jgi:hypothetical protein